MQVIPVPWIEPDDVTNALLNLVPDEGGYVIGTSMVSTPGACS
jgi:hypothetical protein